MDHESQDLEDHQDDEEEERLRQWQQSLESPPVLDEGAEWELESAPDDGSPPILITSVRSLAENKDEEAESQEPSTSGLSQLNGPHMDGQNKRVKRVTFNLEPFEHQNDGSDANRSQFESPEVHRNDNLNPKQNGNLNSNISNLEDHTADNAEESNEVMFKGNPNIKYPIKYQPGKPGVVRKTFRCWFCPSIQYDLKEYNLHKKRHIIKSALECPQCSFSCEKPISMKAHMAFHNFNGQGSSLKSILKNGDAPPVSKPKKMVINKNEKIIINQHQQRKYQCKICPAMFWAYRSFQRHQNCHMDVNKSNYTTRTDFAGTHRSFKGHLRREYVNKDSATPFPSSSSSNQQRVRKKNFICSTCPTKFYTQKDLSRHMQRHNDLTGEFKCTLCNYTVNVKHALERHLKWHSTPAKPIKSGGQNGVTVVRDLEKSTQRTAKLLKDKKCKTVLVDATVKCDKCPSSFRRTIDLVNHSRSHGQKKAFTCHKCDYSVASLPRLRKHISLHTIQNLKSRRNRSRNLKNKRSNTCRTGPVTNGLITKEELDQIKIGNPEFEYPRSFKIGSTGKRVALNHKCLLCPRALASVQEWLGHQASTHGRKHSRRHRCKQCRYSTTIQKRLEAHIKTHKKTIAKNYKPKTGLSKAIIKPPVVIPKPPPKKKTEKSISVISRPRDKVPCLISRMKMSNFLSVRENELDFDSKHIISVSGESSVTSNILACLFGLGYDLLIGLNEPSTLFGVNLKGDTSSGNGGYVEIDINVSRSEELNELYGPHLKIRRNTTGSTDFEACQIVISYKNVSEEISAEELMDIMTKLMPVWALRFIVLCDENVRFCAENFQLCVECFWKIFEHKNRDLHRELTQVKLEINDFTGDLNSRNARVVYLKEAISNYKESDQRHLVLLAGSQKIELENVESELEFVSTTLNELVLKRTVILDQFNAAVQKLVDKMRIPFKAFLKSFNYYGDIVVEETEFVVWIERNHPKVPPVPLPVGIDQAKRIFTGLSMGKRKLAVMGIMIGFWRVLDCSPLVICDGVSSDSNFNLPTDAVAVVFDLFRKQGEKNNTQFLVSMEDPQANVVTGN